MTRQIKKFFIPILLLAFILFDLLWTYGFHTTRLRSLSVISITLFFLIFYKLNKSFIIAKIILIYLVVLGIINSDLSFTFLVALIQDIGSVSVIFSVLFLSRLFALKPNIYLLIIIILAIGYFSLTIPLMDTSMFSQYANRDYAFQSIEISSSNIYNAQRVVYRSQSIVVSLLLSTLLITPLIFTKNTTNILRFFLIISTSIILFYSFYYQKRQPFLELLLISIIINFGYRKQLKYLISSNLFFRIILASGFIFFILSSDLSQNVIQRFSSELSDVGNFDRMNEARVFFSSIDSFDLIFGRGFGGILENTPGRTIMHLGYINILFKGGLILLILYVGALFYNIYYCSKMSKKNMLYSVGVFSSLFLMIQLFYSPAYSWTLSSISAGFGLFSRFLISDIIIIREQNAK